MAICAERGLVNGWYIERDSTVEMELASWLRREIRRSNKEIEALGIMHEDLRRDSIHWNEELGRALIIDFHRSTLNRWPALKRIRLAKRRLCQTESDVKHLRAL